MLGIGVRPLGHSGWNIQLVSLAGMGLVGETVSNRREIGYEKAYDPGIGGFVCFFRMFRW